MAITYTTPWPDMPTVKVPKLHKIIYAHSVDGVDAQYQRSYKDHLVDEWLKANCRAPYYHSTYHTEKFIQFEDDKEAVMFALRWA
jgi:hypothetical protein